jgi:hypothetical protein
VCCGNVDVLILNELFTKFTSIPVNAPVAEIIFAEYGTGSAYE